MTLRKFMHPRNKYREEPDFRKLAILYPEFRNIAITDLSGKVRINFRNEESLRVLTKILLKHDFNLEVEIPKSKLVPTLPLRLNYVLWIEDLLKHVGINDMKAVHGIDIGTGAVCIYPLLFVKLFDCKMSCSEIDSLSIKSAEDNIRRNNLEDNIKVISVPKELILTPFTNLENVKSYSFVVCNPPFFTSDGNQEITPKQSPPRNAPTGNECELTVEGGEVVFITRLIDDSLRLQERIKIYTTMIGRKRNLILLKSKLKARNISNITWTEFCQGNTKRWGLAWSFIDKSILDLSNAPTIKVKMDILKEKKCKKTLDIFFPPHEKLNSAEEVVAAFQSCISDLNIEVKSLKFDKEHQAFKITAFEDSWSHARRKRRIALQQKFNFEKSIEKKEKEFEDNQSREMREPLLVFLLVFDEIIAGGNKEKNDRRLRISMMFERGTGGKNCLETFRQYLVNKLNVRKYFQTCQKIKS